MAVVGHVRTLDEVRQLMVELGPETPKQDEVGCIAGIGKQALSLVEQARRSMSEACEAPGRGPWTRPWRGSADRISWHPIAAPGTLQTKFSKWFRSQHVLRHSPKVIGKTQNA